jgi:hypothetical protein
VLKSTETAKIGDRINGKDAESGDRNVRLEVPSPFGSMLQQQTRAPSARTASSQLLVGGLNQKHTATRLVRFWVVSQENSEGQTATVLLSMVIVESKGQFKPAHSRSQPASQPPSDLPARLIT